MKEASIPDSRVGHAQSSSLIKAGFKATGRILVSKEKAKCSMKMGMSMRVGMNSR